MKKQLWCVLSPTEHTVTLRTCQLLWGKVCQKEVSVLRDTGCNGVVVKKDFVNNDQFTGECGALRCIHGHVESVPKADIEISTPYFTGTVSALCLPNPPHDLIIGNIEGARAADNPDPEWQHICAVTTRAQAKKDNATVPLKIKDSFNIPDVNKDKVARTSSEMTHQWRNTGTKWVLHLCRARQMLVLK